MLARSLARWLVHLVSQDNRRLPSSSVLEVVVKMVHLSVSDEKRLVVRQSRKEER